MKKSEKSFRRKGLFLAAVMVLSAVAGGCGKNGNSGGTAANNYEPYGKYESEVTLKAVKSITSEKFVNGDDISSNVWTRSYQDDLGIKVNYMWTVPESQYDQKMNITIASGDLPDIFAVSPKQYNQLIEAGKIADITQAYEKTATDRLKDVINSNPQADEYNRVDGKIMGLCGVASPYDAADLIWLRTDWLKKLGLEPPKTMEELNHIIKAFANDDPDGDGNKNTYGLAMCKELVGGIGGIQGYLAGYHAYINMWYDNGNGELIFGSIQPEMKTALLALQDLMKAGAIDPEFGVKDTNKIQEDLGASKVGVSIGAMWQPNSGIKSVVELNKKADWYPYALVSIDDAPACTMVDSTPKSYTVVNKDYKYPEAYFKMLNLYADRYLYPETLEIYRTYAHGDGMEYFKYATFQISLATKNVEASRKIRNALVTGDESQLDPNLKENCEQLRQYDEVDKKSWSQMRISGENGAFHVIDDEYLKKDRLKLNAYYDNPTKTMTEKLATLEKMQDEVFTKIILGEDISSFDTFVEDWKRLGGEQITKEVNDWYKEKNK